MFLRESERGAGSPAGSDEEYAQTEATHLTVELHVMWGGLPS